MTPYVITIKSDYQELWRYNIIVMGEVLVNGERVELLKLKDEIAPLDSDLAAPPEGCELNRKIVLQSVPGEELVLCIYLLPHTLYYDRTSKEYRPFDLTIAVEHNNKMEFRKHFFVNYWSGINIDLFL